MRTWVCRCVANIVCWEWCLSVHLIVLQAMWSSKYRSSNSGRGILRLISCSVVLIELVVRLFLSTDTDLFQMFSWISLMFLWGHPPQNFIWAYPTLLMYLTSYIVCCTLVWEDVKYSMQVDDDDDVCWIQNEQNNVLL